MWRRSSRTMTVCQMHSPTLKTSPRQQLITNTLLACDFTCPTCVNSQRCNSSPTIAICSKTYPVETQQKDLTLFHWSKLFLQEILNRRALRQHADKFQRAWTVQQCSGQLTFYELVSSHHDIHRPTLSEARHYKSRNVRFDQKCLRRSLLSV